jgi:multisubunit Na+/H+ antiporter MnhG subunit
VKTAAIDALIGLALLGAWLGCFGFLRLRTALDRLHVVTFVAAGAGLPIAAAAFIADGASDRAWKILLLVVLQLGTGAALAHAIGRAVLLRAPAEERLE